MATQTICGVSPWSRDVTQQYESDWFNSERLRWADHYPATCYHSPCDTREGGVDLRKRSPIIFNQWRSIISTDTPPQLHQSSCQLGTIVIKAPAPFHSSFFQSHCSTLYAPSQHYLSPQVLKRRGNGQKKICYCVKTNKNISPLEKVCMCSQEHIPVSSTHTSLHPSPSSTHTHTHTMTLASAGLFVSARQVIHF